MDGIFHPWDLAGSILNVVEAVKLFAAAGTFFVVGVILTIRQPRSPNRALCTMVPRKVYNLCQGPTVTSELACDPSQCPQKVFHKLVEGQTRKKDSVEDLHDDKLSKWDTLDELQKARACGQFGSTETSDLFLKVYHDALCSLEKNPKSGVVSPKLLGSTGVVPLTIVAPLPDLCRHLANCIARAESEVFLGTNFWIHSDASTLVTNAIRELSKRAGQRGQKVVMKMIYDRGDPRQYIDGKVKLPAASEIPNVDLQVINFHRPVFGTFHAKFTVIDRRIALIQSSNIQDNDNLEMLAHIEGPIVDSFYDAALLSWGKPLKPPFSLLNSPAANAPIPCHGEQSDGIPLADGNGVLAEHTTTSPSYDVDLNHEAWRVNNRIHPKGNETRTKAVSRHLSMYSFTYSG
ncbi:hypothetical protein N7457_008800 [Penicillium paradoxum]|uniref:uncharacterized protein n=1 Tax=Penicillium paradoxum TaxID=176176 RepID=UPI002548B6E1|nr:uncharacterized protein N7457_008800 [Penicillium paradoxum]KAJ5773904.1 hypothetical protein N7457_008800 [Penicillium paradoxum]